MKLINERLNYTKSWMLPDAYLFTGNTIIKKDGAIVMGRGAAKQIRDFYPGIDKRFGALLKADPDRYLGWVALIERQYLGWFKVKNHWKDNAEYGLIESSAKSLALTADSRPNWTFHMNYPGIGNGHLEIGDLHPMLLEILPDNVILYR